MQILSAAAAAVYSAAAFMRETRQAMGVGMHHSKRLVERSHLLRIDQPFVAIDQRVLV